MTNQELDVFLDFCRENPAQVPPAVMTWLQHQRDLRHKEAVGNVLALHSRESDRYYDLMLDGVPLKHVVGTPNVHAQAPLPDGPQLPLMAMGDWGYSGGRVTYFLPVPQVRREDFPCTLSIDIALGNMHLSPLPR